MTEAQREKFMQRLLQLHAELTDKAPLRIEPNRTDEGRVGGDEDEQPLNEMMQAIASNRNRNSDVVLKRVLKALGKLRQAPESFGECEECGDEISPARLEAVPYVEFCVNCQGQKDAPKGGPTRKRLTDYS